MKVVIYNAQSFEKELLARANQKRHDITLIANPLNGDTIHYSREKDVAVVAEGDALNKAVIDALQVLGVRYLITRSPGAEHIDRTAAARAGMKIAQLRQADAMALATEVIGILDNWHMNKCVGSACACGHACRIRK